ncbi:hypothetical protein LJR260_003524 [Variovorax paradoxus]|uniref:hypothetical protein n=1 Tax=Variovorax paradoxus TaxID=34073 RepID=UPI003395DB4D
MLCENCNALNSKRTREYGAHADLKHVDSQNWSKIAGGMAKGSIEHYECQVCGTKMVADRDKNDEYAIWEIE